MTNHEAHDEDRPLLEDTPQPGDIVECPRCGNETTIRSDGPTLCPECGNDLAPGPITPGTDAPAPG